jgi:hypothetical protein
VSSIKSQTEAFDLFRRWRDNKTSLRVDTDLAVIGFSFECMIRRVEEPLIDLLIGDCGFIDLTFNSSWNYNFAAPDAMRAPLNQRLGYSPLASRIYEYGEVVLARRTTGSTILFLEIVKRNQ